MPRTAVVVKGYPRLSETFIAQEILGLERQGLDQVIVSLRHPTDKAVHAMHREIRAPVLYLPEYLYREPLRVLRGVIRATRLAGFRRAAVLWLRDLLRDRTANRSRRFGQACVLAAELPADVERLHAHFLHTPASVARYAAVMRGLPWSFSAHAKDIWTTPDWEKREKLADAAWGVTCTASGAVHLNGLAPAGAPDPVRLVYHGLDLGRFPVPPARSPRNGRDPGDPVRILSVGRGVEKKGFDTAVEALAALPPDLAWRWTHVGGGGLIPALKALAAARGVADRIEWRGARAQDEVIAAYAEADIFVLPSRVAADGDRDGLPNVLMEAQAMGVACIATPVSGIPELILDGETGVLVPPGDPAALAGAIAALARDPVRRAALADAGRARVQAHFTFDGGLALLAARFGIGDPPAVGAPAFGARVPRHARG
ncbi:MAG TPA: glycosyltransferase family 4 protein [Azospirillaceae bacterium]|nr:glycosyltransferase family 4 protein [Azospirillaceae bacterium]